MLREKSRPVSVSLGVGVCFARARGDEWDLKSGNWLREVASTLKMEGVGLIALLLVAGVVALGSCSCKSGGGELTDDGEPKPSDDLTHSVFW